MIVVPRWRNMPKLVATASRVHLRKTVKLQLLVFPLFHFLTSSTRTQSERVDRFRCLMTQTTRSDARMCLCKINDFRLTRFLRVSHQRINTLRSILAEITQCANAQHSSNISQRCSNVKKASLKGKCQPSVPEAHLSNLLSYTDAPFCKPFRSAVAISL